MSSTNPLAAMTLTALVGLAPQVSYSDVEPAVMLNDAQMPGTVPNELRNNILLTKKQNSEPFDVKAIYQTLKKDFDLPNVQFAKWLGVKDRTFYNWLKDPERSTTYGPQIEERLYSLYVLYKEMEPVHRQHLFKIAFSPIYGDPNFGKAILKGNEDATLVDWYGRLFAKFESYRKVIARRA